MSGFVRADNPDSGPKYGEWSISREEIVNQLALQGLTETGPGLDYYPNERRDSSRKRQNVFYCL